MILGFLLSLRPKQWTKNLLLFAGVVFGRRWTDPGSLLNAIAGFAVFCALSGVVYIFNDIVDAEQDRQHAKKCKRPIASGRISPFQAGVGAVVLAILAVGGSFFCLPANFTYLAVGYLVLVSAYSFYLKHVVILDILILAMGFVIRALAGIEVIQIYPADPLEITSFFLLTALFLALFLATGKRRSELITLGETAGNHRRVLNDYSPQYLDILLTIATAGTLFSYALWTTQSKFAQPAGAERVDNPYLLVLTMPFVVYGVFRYLWLAYQKHEGGAPEALLIEDKPLLATVVLWVITVVAVLLRLS